MRTKEKGPGQQPGSPQDNFAPLDNPALDSKQEYLHALADEIATLAAWNDDLSARIQRIELLFQSSHGIHERQRDRLLCEGEAWKTAANSLVKRLSHD